MGDTKATNATPTARARAKLAKKRRDWRPAFLDGFQKSGTVAGGCKAADVARSTAYRERQRDETFALAWADIEAGVTEALEQTALVMAMRGEVRLIEFLLKARKPEMYRECRVLEHQGPGGGPVELVQLGVDISKLTDRELRILQRLVTRAMAPNT
jgi:hypothetical protein